MGMFNDSMFFEIITFCKVFSAIEASKFVHEMFKRYSGGHIEYASNVIPNLFNVRFSFRVIYGDDFVNDTLRFRIVRHGSAVGCVP